MRNKLVVLSVGLTMLLTGNGSMAGVITLYDGASGVTPNQYNAPSQWLNFGSLNGGTQSVSGGLTNLNTSSSNVTYAGYSNYNVANPPVSSSVITPTTLVNSSFPSLDRNAGYNLDFTVRINSQANNGTNGAYRAGFSFIVLSSDKQGIEIGFRNNDIFAQVNASFNSIYPAEQITSANSLLSNLTTYNLNVSGNNYTLTSNATTLLSGLNFIS
ncbi:choice-of-anchor Y domain-containing protein [Nostoc sp.]|uniref:choice-of-anchor Y domain-containing protein n=1 Tax=Nostoc sp. TaxID=1180 RepID=UPI002FFCAF4C